MATGSGLDLEVRFMEKVLGSTPVSIHDVYYDAGIDSSTNQRRFVRAPFQLVKIAGEVHIRPTGTCENPDMFGALSTTDDEWLRMWRDDLGYLNLPIVVQESEMGDYENKGKDNWMGKFSMGRK